MDLALVSDTAMSVILSIVAFQEKYGDSSMLTGAYESLSNFYWGIESARIADPSMSVHESM